MCGGRRGLYALPTADPALVAARAAGGVSTCLSTAQALGLPLRSRPVAPHVAVPQTRGTLLTPHPRVVVHRDAHISTGADPRSVPLPLALAHATKCLPTPDAVALVDGALHRGLVDLADLRAYRPRVGVVGFERVLRLADGSAQSFPESLARLALRSTGLRVLTQVHVPGVGRVDFLVEGLVIVEIDGRAFHTDRVQFVEDRRRDRAALRQGLLTLRFTAADALGPTHELRSSVTSAAHQARALARTRPALAS